MIKNKPSRRKRKRGLVHVQKTNKPGKCNDISAAELKRKNQKRAAQKAARKRNRNR